MREAGPGPELVVERPAVGPVDGAGGAAARLIATLLRHDAVVLTGLVALAAILRFVDLPTRGTWDSDQGHDMLVLRALVADGVVPLLGPPTSIGEFHHGAWYYYLLAPAAAVFGPRPEVVVATIAAANVVAVGLTWWVGRALSGPVGGAVAGLAMAVSASAIEESTFIWNPNLIPLSASLALAGAFRAWTTGRARWWLLAAVGVALTMQSHVLGTALLPPVAAFLLADAWRRRRADPAGRRRVLLAGVAGIGVLGVAYAPLAVHELTTGFSETRAALDYLGETGEPVAIGPVARLLLVVLRILAWPIVGLVTDALVASVVAAAVVVAILAWRSRAAVGAERTAARWFAATLAWSAVALAVAARGLASVVPGLPNDHYHAFLDPIVFVSLGLGAAAAWRVGTIGRLVAVVSVAALVAFNAARWPPAVAPDGGWPAARDAAERIERAVGRRPVALLGLPEFKPSDAIGFPLVDRGIVPLGSDRADALVVVCDSLFEAAIGAPCGGPAEEAAARPGRFSRLVDRFPVSTRTIVSIYLPDDAAAR